MSTTVGTSKANVQRILLEMDSVGAIKQQNYYDNELWQYYNEALKSLSVELMKWNSKLDVQNSTAVFLADAYEDTTTLGALSVPFLSFALNEKSKPKVFNISQADYPRMSKAEESEIDTWENETSADSGIPDKFYLRGLKLYIHPRAKDSTTVKFYYNPLRQIVNDSSTMPWDDLFNGAIENFVIARSRMRAELASYSPSLDVTLHDNLRKAAWDVIYQREGFNLNFDDGCGWD
jgi:hypothetical protein